MACATVEVTGGALDCAVRVDEYAAFDATGLAAAIAGGEVSAGDVCEAALRAIERVDRKLHGVVAGPYADTTAAGDGAFSGVPFAVKDTLSERGRPLGFGTSLLEGFVARRDSTLAGRFRAAGLVSLARTATPEFAFNFDTAPRVHGATRNPWDRERSPGGSSGGSAALVASGAVPMAHGTDGAGSIRIPASFCGLVGLKPSRGRVPVGPDVGEAVGGFAHQFALTRTVRDAAALLDAIAGPAPGDRYFVAQPDTSFASAVDRRPAGLRIALHTTAYGDIPTAAPVVRAVEHAASVLESLGHHIEPAFPGLDFDGLLRACEVIWSVDLAASARTFASLTGRLPGPDTVEAASLACIKRGETASALELILAGAYVNRTARRWGRFLDEHDALLTPTVAITVPPSGWPRQDDPRFDTAAAWIGEIFPHIPFTPVANLTGQPAISLPLGQDDDGLPIGVMLTTQTLREDLLLSLAATLEEALPWSTRRPLAHVATP